MMRKLRWGFRALYSGLAVASLLGGALALVAGPNAQAAVTRSLVVSFSASGSGASAGFSTVTGNPQLTVGSPSSSTFAEMQVINGGSAVPTSEPYFATENFAAGSPRWVIELANGNSLWGYPPNSGLNGTDFAWTVDNGNTYTSYADAYAAADASSTTVTAAFVVADGDQAPGTTDNLTQVQYAGMTLPQMYCLTDGGGLSLAAGATKKAVLQVGTSCTPVALQAASGAATTDVIRIEDSGSCADLVSSHYVFQRGCFKNSGDVWNLHASTANNMIQNPKTKLDLTATGSIPGSPLKGEKGSPGPDNTWTIMPLP